MPAVFSGLFRQSVTPIPYPTRSRGYARQGLSLVETMVAAALLVTVIAAVYSSIVFTVKTDVNTAQDIQVKQMAASICDQIGGQGYSAINKSIQSNTAFPPIYTSYFSAIGNVGYYDSTGAASSKKTGVPPGLTLRNGVPVGVKMDMGKTHRQNEAALSSTSGDVKLAVGEVTVTATRATGGVLGYYVTTRLRYARSGAGAVLNASSPSVLVTRFISDIPSSTSCN